MNTDTWACSVAERLRKLCRFVDLQIEHDSGGLHDGMGAQQQALHNKSYISSGCRRSWRRNLHRHRCGGQC